MEIKLDVTFSLAREAELISDLSVYKRQIISIFVTEVFTKNTKIHVP